MNHRLEQAQLFLVRCVATSALLISPALAQVNGPGPSPSNLFDVVLNLPGDEAIITGADDESIGGVSGQTSQLIVSEGGIVGPFFDALSGSEVNISGGTVGRDFDAWYGSEVNINGGTVGSFSAQYGSLVNISGGVVDERFFADFSSVVNISGGTVGILFDAQSGSEVNISGGTVGDRFSARSGSEVNISGGTVGLGFDAKSGSEVNISGGVLGRCFNARSGSDVELIGGEFRLHGTDFTDGTISSDPGDIFTGTLSDGSSFIFRDFGKFGGSFSDELNDITLTRVDLPPADTNPIVLNAPITSGPYGLRKGQELTVVAGGSLGTNFAVVDATLNVEAGTVGEGAEAYGSLVNISGGMVGAFFEALGGSEVNISGGTVGDYSSAWYGSVVNISGGVIGDSFYAFSGSVVNISGGVISDRFYSYSGSVVNITGSAFSIDGTPLNDPQPSQPTTIADRYVTLSGVLADGEPFSFYLNPGNSLSDDFFQSGSTVTVTLEPPFLLGDCNRDGVVNFLDISPFIAILSSDSFLAQADCNEDGVVNFLDIQPFIQILGNA